MAGIGGAIAEGLESGFGMGLRADQAQLQKNQDQRAQQELNLRQSIEQRTAKRQGMLDNLDLMGRQQQLLSAQSQDIVARSTGAQAAGQPIDPDDAAAYGQVQQQLAQTRQQALNFFSRAQTGQLDPLQADPSQLYMNLTAATGMKPNQLLQMPQHIADVHAAMDTGNQGLLVQGVNGLMQPMLQRGVGSESPHGGTITRKEIIGLDPAVDNDHNPLPGKFMPRLRVYVRRDGDDHEQYYDAPMTVDGSTDDKSPVAVIDTTKAMNWMGNLGTLATALQNPDAQAKLAEGEKTAGPAADKYLQQLTNVSRPPKMRGSAQDRLSAITQYAKDNKVSNEDAANALQSMGVLPALNTMAQRMSAIDDLDIPEDQKEVMRRDIALGAGGKTTGLIPQKPTGTPAPDMGDTTLTGDAYLKSLPAADAAVIKALDDGRMDIKSLSTKGGHREEMMAKWAQYNGNANARNYTTGQGTENAFAKGVEGRSVRSFNVAVDHLDTLGKMADALGNGNIQALNAAKNRIETEFGQAAPTNFDGVKNIVADEVTKAIIGSGGALADREKTAEQIKSASSPEQLKGIISSFQQLMSGQLKGLAQQYYGGNGLKDFNDFLSPRTKELVGDLPRPPARQAPAAPAQFQTNDPAAMRAQIQASGDTGLMAAFDQQFPQLRNGGATQAPASPRAAPVQIKDAAGYNALPSGATFIDPKGVTRRKP